MEEFAETRMPPSKRLYSAMTLGADDVKSNQNFGGTYHAGKHWLPNDALDFVTALSH